LFPNLEGSQYRLNILNEYLRPISEEMIRLDGITMLRAMVSQGYTVKLTRVIEEDRP